MITFDADGVVLGLDIQDNGKQFLDVSISLEGEYINYHRSGELMEYSDLVELKHALNALMRNEIESTTIIAGAEPDWYFTIYPLVEEPYIEFSVCFWAPDGEMSANEFTLALSSVEVPKLSRYISEVLDE